MRKLFSISHTEEFLEISILQKCPKKSWVRSDNVILKKPETVYSMQ